jgi:long-chain fatty acid transport protein
MFKARLLACAGLATLCLASQAYAGGFYLQEQSARGAGRAYSGEVADSGVSSLWWNPAAIARSGGEAYVGAHGIFVDSTATNTRSTVTYPGGLTVPVRGEPTAFKPIAAGMAPNLAVAVPLGDRFAVGLSASAPFNFTTKYNRAAWNRYDALTSQLRTVDLQLTGAMKVTDWLDVGVSGNAERMKAHLSNASPNLSPLLPDAFQELRGSGWDYGWAAGAQMHFGGLTVGASYRSKIKHKLDGRIVVSGLLGPLAAANLNAPAAASFTTPWIATLGARYALTDRLTLNGQVQRIGWGEFDAITVRAPTGVQRLAQDYKDITSGGVGLDYAISPALTLRTGVQYDPTPTPDIGRTSRVPDSDRWLFGAGATANAPGGMKVDAALAYIHFTGGRISHAATFYGGTPAATGSNLAGEVKGEGYVLSLGLRKSF